MENQLENNNFYAFIRHAQRGDTGTFDINQVLPKSQHNEVDPPITKFGILQSESTGKFLKKYFDQQNLNFTKIVIKSSPFIRTIMTASGIAKGMEIQNPIIFIDYQLSEFLGPSLFNECPISKIEYTKCNGNEESLNKMKQKYKISEDIKIEKWYDNFELKNDKILKVFPEQMSQGLLRAFISQQTILEEQKQYMNREQYKKGESICFLNITHCLQVGWVAQVNQIYTQIFPSTQINPTYSFIHQNDNTVLKSNYLNSFQKILTQIQQQNDGKNNEIIIDLENQKQLTKIIKKIDLSFAGYCGISAALVSFERDSLNNNLKLKYFNELMRIENPLSKL